MTAAAAKRSDPMVDVPVLAAQIVAIKDLMWLDPADGQGKRAQDMADQLTEPLNQAYFAARFLGVSEHAKRAVDTTRLKIAVWNGLDVEHEFPCTSETHLYGDLMGVAESAGGVALESQKLEKVTSLSRAIFYCVRADTAAATTALVKRLPSVGVSATGNGVAGAGGAYTATLAADINVGTLTRTPRVLVLDPGGATRKVILPVEAEGEGVVIDIVNTADAAEDLTVRDSADAATVCTISQNERGSVCGNGLAWYGRTGAQT